MFLICAASALTGCGQFRSTEIGDLRLAKRLESARGFIPAAEAIGVEEAKFICVVGDSSSVDSARRQLWEEFKAVVPPFRKRGEENDLIYILTPNGETFVPLRTVSISAALSDCERADAVFHKVYGNWEIGPPPGTNRGSPEGQRLLARLAAADSPIAVEDVLGISDIEYVCLEPGGSPQVHIQTIATLFDEQLPRSVLGAPTRTRYEHDIYVRSAKGERRVTIAANEGLSADGERCVKGAKGIFQKGPGEPDWRLATDR